MALPVLLPQSHPALYRMVVHTTVAFMLLPRLHVGVGAPPKWSEPLTAPVYTRVGLIIAIVVVAIKPFGSASLAEIELTTVMNKRKPPKLKLLTRTKACTQKTSKKW